MRSALSDEGKEVHRLLCQAYGKVYRQGDMAWQPETDKERESIRETVKWFVQKVSDPENYKQAAAGLMLASKQYDEERLPDGRFEVWNLPSKPFHTYALKWANENKSWQNRWAQTIWPEEIRQDDDEDKEDEHDKG